MTSSYLVFTLAGRLFGARLSGAIEILTHRQTRRVPLSYSYVEGLIDYRGAIYPVFNIAQRLGISAPTPIGFAAPVRDTGGQSIILLEERKIQFGILVDSVARMAKLDDPAGADAQAKGIDSKYLKGVVLDDDQEILILDFERLLHAG